MIVLTLIKNGLISLLVSYGILLQVKEPSKVQEVPPTEEAKENKLNILDYTERGIIEKSASQLKSYYEYIKSGGVVEDPLIPYRPVTNLYYMLKEKMAEEKSKDLENGNIESSTIDNTKKN